MLPETAAEGACAVAARIVEAVRHGALPGGRQVADGDGLRGGLVVPGPRSQLLGADAGRRRAPSTPPSGTAATAVVSGRRLPAAREWPSPRRGSVPSGEEATRRTPPAGRRADIGRAVGVTDANPAGLGPVVTKAVIPAAGLGTRFLPATKATPKEMLPVVDKPAIQYVVEEAVAAGLEDVLMITGRNKRPLEDHFDRACELEAGARRPRATPTGSAGCRSRTISPTSTTSARATRAASATRCCCAADHVGRRAVRGAARRRPHRPARPAAGRMIDGPAPDRRQRRRADGGPARADPPLRLRGGRGDRRRRTSSAITDLVEKPDAADGAEQPRRHRPLRARPGGLRRPASPPSPGAAARSS